MSKFRKQGQSRRIGPVTEFDSISAEDARTSVEGDNVHLVSPHQWAKIAATLVTPENLPWLRGHLGVTLYGFIAVDFTGLSFRHRRLVLDALYGGDDPPMVEVAKER